MGVKQLNDKSKSTLLSFQNRENNMEIKEMQSNNGQEKETKKQSKNIVNQKPQN